MKRGASTHTRLHAGCGRRASRHGAHRGAAGVDECGNCRGKGIYRGSIGICSAQAGPCVGLLQRDSPCLGGTPIKSKGQQFGDAARTPGGCAPGVCVHVLLVYSGAQGRPRLLATCRCFYVGYHVYVNHIIYRSHEAGQASLRRRLCKPPPAPGDAQGAVGAAALMRGASTINTALACSKDAPNCTRARRSGASLLAPSHLHMY